MGADSKIEWCDHTMNFWVGCTKLSPACDNCYAEGWAKRTGQSHLWNGERRETTLANRHKAHKWNRQALAEGRRYRVFTNSLADFFDNQVPSQWRREAWHVIEQTPHLDWLILTKRPQNIAGMLPDPETGVQPWGDGWKNVWLGTTAENQPEADRRIPHLLATPAAVRFISAEPLLGPVDFTTLDADGFWMNVLTGEMEVHAQVLNCIDWIIVGGESGPGARPMHPDWARSIRDRCAAAGTAFFFKQWGEWAPSKPEKAYSNPRSGWRCLKGHPHVAKREELYPEAGAAFIEHMGKKAAGRLLDGIEHNAMPQVRI